MPIVTYSLISKKIANRVNLEIIKAGGGTFLTFPGKEAGIYAIEHKPTKSMYIGSSRNLQQIHQSWFYRLAHKDTTPILNWAFLAVYTARPDFVFHVLATIPNDALFNQTALEMERKVKERITLKGKEFLLNCNNSSETREFWVSRVPVEERHAKFGKSAHNTKAIPILPYDPPSQVEPNNGNSVVHPDNGGVVASIVSGVIDAEVRKLDEQAAKATLSVERPEKVQLVPGKYTEHALGTQLARTNHVEFLRRKYYDTYSEYFVKDNGTPYDEGEVWAIWESTSHITHSLERQASTIKAMRVRVLSQPV